MSRVRLPAGMRDFLPHAARRRRRVTHALMETFRLHGYLPVSSPLFEHAEVLDRGLGEELRKDVLRFVGGDGDVVALRPDITPQIARIAAQRFSADAPLRFCYEGLVARRADQSGRLQQLQVGVEYLGAGHEIADHEVLALAAASLDNVGAKKWVMEVGHVGLVTHVLSKFDDEHRHALLKFLEKKDITSARKFANTQTKAKRELVLGFLELEGNPTRVFKKALLLKIPQSIKRSLTQLAESVRVARKSNRFAVTADLTQVRGLSYYSGLRFVVHAEGASDVIVRGGRYDGLAEKFGASLPGAGFGISVDRLLECEVTSLVERKMVAVVVDKSCHAKGIKQCEALRKKGIGAALHITAKRKHIHLLQNHGYDQVMYMKDSQWYAASGSEI